MDIDEGVPLPKKLTTPLPELPKMIPPSDGAAKGTELPKKLGRAPEGVPGVPLPPKLTASPIGEQLPKVTLKPADVVLTGQKLDPGFKASDAMPIRVLEDQSRPRIQPVTIQRPVEESARLAGSGFDLEKIKRDAQQRVPNVFDRPAELPSKLRALGNREEKVFEPAGSSIPSFVASDNTAIKLSESLSRTGPKTGPLTLAKCGMEFEAPKIGQPMMRRVKIVWPTPMEKAPTQPAGAFKSVGSACELQGMKPDASSFPGQTLPTGAQPVQLRASEEKPLPKAQIPMPKRPEPVFIGLQSPPPAPESKGAQSPPRFLPRELGPGEGRPSIDEILAEAEKRIEGLIGQAADITKRNPAELIETLVERAPSRVMAEIAKRAQDIIAREAKAKDLEAENAALREIVKTLGGKVALYEVELQLMKAKKG